MPYPHAAENDVIVRVHAAGFTPGELDWPATWTDRAGRDRTPSIPGHELSGTVASAGVCARRGTSGRRPAAGTPRSRSGRPASARPGRAS
ncbi:alcohol dehydrogenase catalytic domain-containing protein [Lentzea miocenica]|uniref:alcohol dehydrogenase catalytic domain-containing protein n=1 Tax=Lentzea miocenica TaxID=3095431 RepID=UPI003872A8ED